MAPSVCEFHEEREFNFEPVIPGVEHIRGTYEELSLIAAVPPSASIRIETMPPAGVAVGAVPGAGRRMPAVRRGMRNNRCAVAG